MLVDPESVKKIENLTVFFTLLGSVGVKAVRRMLMKLSPTLFFLLFSLNQQNTLEKLVARREIIVVVVFL